VRVIGRHGQEYRLLDRPGSNQVFPLRDPADPLHRVSPPFADPDGRLHPKVQVLKVVLGPHFRKLMEMAKDSDEERLVLPPGVKVTEWVNEKKEQMEQDVRQLLEATISEPRAEPRVEPRILRPQDVLTHEEGLIGQYGTFLTSQELSAEPGRRALLSEGRVLGLYGGAVLDGEEAVEQWAETHPNFPEYALTVTGRGGHREDEVIISAEGFGTTVAFANTRLLPGPPGPDGPLRDHGVTGINALFLTFHVRITDNTGTGRWQSIAALAGLDNLYPPHNRSGMVIADYGADYELPAPGGPPDPAVKTEPGTPPPIPPPAAGGGRHSPGPPAAPVPVRDETGDGTGTSHARDTAAEAEPGLSLRPISWPAGTPVATRKSARRSGRAGRRPEPGAGATGTAPESTR
jgi:hypothetical protein